MDFHPDVVLLLLHPNDFENNVHAEEYWHFKPYFTIEPDGLKLHPVPVPQATFPQRHDRFLWGGTYLGPRLFVAKSFLCRGMKLSRRGQIAEGPASAEDERRMDDLLHRLIAALNELCRTHECRFTLVSCPQAAERRLFLPAIT